MTDAPENALSQDDIDRLLNGDGQEAPGNNEIGPIQNLGPSDAEATELPPPAEVLPSSESQARFAGAMGTVVPLDLANQDRIVRGRMPTLEVLNDRFGRALRGSLFSYLRVNADITPRSAQIIKYGEFISKISVPSYFVMVSMNPIRGSALFVIDPMLCHGVIDAFFGGNGKQPAKLEGRDFSAIEQRVFNNIITYAMRDLEAAWEPVVEFEMNMLRADVKAQFVGIATPSEIVIVNAFDVEMDHWRGNFYVCIPYRSVEPFREQLVSGVAADRMESDARWAGALHVELQDAVVEARVVLASRLLVFNNLRTLKAGDILYFDPPEEVTMYIEGVPIAKGRHGVCKNRYAVRVEQYLHPDTQDVFAAAIRQFNGRKGGMNEEQEGE